MNPRTLPFRPRPGQSSILLSGKPLTNSPDSRSQDYTPPAEEKVTRIISGALAHFDAGAAITKVVFTSDVSAVQLTGLPLDSTPESVLDILRSRGVDTSKVNPIRVIRGDSYSSARAEAEDPRFAELVVAKFSRQAPSQQHVGLHATPITIETFSTSDSSALRVDCKKIHCSWHKSSKTVWLNFGSDSIASRVNQKFKKGEYKILDQVVHPSNPERGAGRYNPKAWTVTLTDVPGDATESDISRAIRSRMKASARFSKEEEAKDAVKKFHNSPLPFQKTAKLTVQLVYCARFKVSSVIYDAVERQIKANIPRWKMQYVHFTAYEQPQPPKWYRTLKIEGEDCKKVAEAKNVILDILAGIVAKDGSSVLWQPSLRGNGEIYRRLAQLQQQTGVVILRNKAKSQLRLFGPPNKCEEVQTAISKILNDQSSKEYAIELDEEMFRWARLGGYKKLTAVLGSDCVSLDITSTPKRIIINGTASNHETALSIMNGQTPPSARSDPNDQDCPACLTEAEDPIRTRCGHTYCLDCFQNLCLADPKQGSAVEVRCVGDSGRCDTVLDLPQLQENLPSTVFEELLEKSFASYARRHPDMLQYCPSPDCDCVYRANGPVKTHTCRGCLVPICTSCYAPHDGMSCAEYQDVSSGRQEANEKLKREIGIKDCPQCKTPLEKTEGCNHMTCRCGAHICWVCLEFFSVSDACYVHMRQRHGGIGLGDYQERFG
ncbi:hypothetical protein ONZ43_g3177 [Nemania bipapillata]|uniref:Uncharacterized protein n=1 Tax=Nemania bipapillata TaxID=110536 RepID=A0ACC2IXW5_9PEZI|nr:hypothetical protein ONZ43_g3177 [Nemania bipapillata]